jgi:predicted RNase H-like HicB family nuclease
MAEKLNIALRMVVYPEGGWWIAHCLELDIVAEGKTPEKAMRDLQDLCRFQIDVAMKEGDLDSVFRPAPGATWRMFFMGTTKRMPRKAAGLVGKFEARQLALA